MVPFRVATSWQIISTKSTLKIRPQLKKFSRQHYLFIVKQPLITCDSAAKYCRSEKVKFVYKLTEQSGSVNKQDFYVKITHFGLAKRRPRTR
jgi:intergrase/recombinase